MFFITGLPRSSRLAWLAAYLTQGDTVCFYREMSSATDRGNYLVPRIGHAHPSIVHFQDQLIAQFPAAKWVIIESKFGDSVRELNAIGVDTKNLHINESKLEELRAKVTPMVLTIKDLSSEAIIHNLTDFIGSTWNRVPHVSTPRHQLFLGLDIQDRNYPVAPPPNAEPVKLSATCVEYLAEIKKMCAPDVYAYRWFEGVIMTCLVWDHWLDRDGLNPATFDDVMHRLTTEWPINPFFRKYADQMVPVMVAAIDCWKSSYTLGAGKDLAYAVYAQVPAAMAFVLGGKPLVDSSMPTIRELVLKMRKEDDARDGAHKK